MSNNPWLAIDVGTSPVTRARELRQIWDDFLGTGLLDSVRLPIAESWQRSRAAGIDPSRSRAPTLIADRVDVAERWSAHPLQSAVPLMRKWLGTMADTSEHLIVVSDADGLLLWIEGDPKVRSAAADSMNFVEGAVWSEVGAGTNAIGTAVAAEHPVQVHAAEHFNEVVHAWTCSAAPVHDPESGRLLGIVDLTGRMRTAHPQSLAVALATARAVEADLRVRLQERDARLRVRYLATVTSSSEQLALVSRTGRVIADHPDGFLRAERLEVPAGGGDLILPSGEPAFAEPVDHQEAFIVRALRETHGSHRRSDPASTPVDDHQPVNSADRDVTAWSRTQVELSRLAEEQAALRHVATLVAGQAGADEIFAAVAHEVARLLGADRGTVCRYETDDSMTVTAYWSNEERAVPVGTRVGLQGDSVAATVQRLGGPARFDTYKGVSGPVIDLARALGETPRSTVGAPIVVNGRVWGAILVSSTKPEPFPDDTESRLMSFAELVATAISNAVGRDELAASRARIVTTADVTRRRIERNLHDGLQQRLVTLVVELQDVKNAAPTRRELLAELSRIEAELGLALDDLREIARGIHPAILSEGGLEPALRTLARRSSIPVELDVSTTHARLPEHVEVTAYYVVSEALTNTTKHAHASMARIAVRQRNGTLQLSIGDDGAGGADPGRGSGLVGLRDRVEAMGGTIVVDSPVGAGTSLLVELPVH